MYSSFPDSHPEQSECESTHTRTRPGSIRVASAGESDYCGAADASVCANLGVLGQKESTAVRFELTRVAPVDF
jgi:hypothetical protein